MRFQTFAVVITAGLAALFFSGKGISAEFPYPKVEYSADMTMKIEIEGSTQSHDIQGKVFSAKNKERREVSSFGRTTATITDKQTDETLTLMPTQKMYMRNQGSKTHKDPETMVRDGELVLKEEGSEKINGQITIRYKIESAKKDGESFDGHAWFNKQNIPVRFKGTAVGDGMRQNVEVNYFNIVIGTQNPRLFIVPKGYQPLPTGLGGMGGGSDDVSPEQMEQYKEMMKKYKRQ